MDNIEEKESLEQCSNKNENKKNDSSEPEKRFNGEQILMNPEEKGQQEQCDDYERNKTDNSSEPKKGIINRLRSMWLAVSSERGLRIIEVLFIAGASLMVSVMTYRTEQLEYKLNLANSKLHVEVYCDTIDSNGDEHFDTSMFGVKYIDGIYEDFDVDCYSVLKFTYYKGTMHEAKTIDFIIRDYFFAGYLRGGGDYFYARLCEDNWSKFCALNKYLLQEQKEYDSAYVDLYHYAIIRYKNIIGKTEELGYKCGSGGRFDTADSGQIKQYISGLKVNNEITLDDIEPAVFMRYVKELIGDQD